MKLKNCYFFKEEALKVKSNMKALSAFSNVRMKKRTDPGSRQRTERWWVYFEVADYPTKREWKKATAGVPQYPVVLR